MYEQKYGQTVYVWKKQKKKSVDILKSSNLSLIREKKPKQKWDVIFGQLARIKI